MGVMSTDDLINPSDPLVMDEVEFWCALALDFADELDGAEAECRLLQAQLATEQEKVDILLEGLQASTQDYFDAREQAHSAEELAEAMLGDSIDLERQLEESEKLVDHWRDRAIMSDLANDAA